MSNSNKPFNRAVAALNSLLTQVSAINLKHLALRQQIAGGEPSGNEVDILASVEIFGRSHTLACHVSSGSEPDHVHTALELLQSQIADLPGKVTPVLIIPVLSPEVQALCDENQTGCVDLCGNGRLAVDEVFVSMRSLPRRVLHQAASAPAPVLRRSTVAQPAGEGAAQKVLRGFPPVRAVLPHRGVHSAGHARGR